MPKAPQGASAALWAAHAKPLQHFNWAMRLIDAERCA